ncbi:MAG TPA: head decoration protein, partial [Vicinamibacterales bacterium]|nr:head decoration protein [Vicinamibacterales bacterium]
MDKPRLRFTVLPVALVMVLSVFALPALAIVRVDARGMGHEHTQPWRTKAAIALEVSLAAVATMGLAWRRRIRSLIEHPYFKPAAACALLALVALVNTKALLASPLILGTLTEGVHTAEFLRFEAHQSKSRDAITVLSGQTLKAGAVIARVNKGVGRVSVPAVVGTGNGTATAVFAGPEVQVGNYVVTCKTVAANGGVFSVVDPAGNVMPDATVGTPYVGREINFTLNDGSSDFILTDAFTFVVSTTLPLAVGTGTGTISAVSLGP